MSNRRQWVVAVIVAALMSNKGWRAYLKGAWAVFRALVHRKDAEVHADIAEARQRVCEHCPLFFRPLSTCGSPLAEYRPEMGCWCYLPVLSKLKSGHCWIRDNTDLNAGWPDELF